MMIADTPLAGHGFSVQLPATWEGRVYRRPDPSTPFAPDNRTSSTPQGSVRTGWPGDRTRAVLHLGNFPLPAERGDYGSGAVERMTARDVFISCIEFGPECVGTALYSAVGIPRTEPAFFEPNALQRRLPGQSGCQYFFTETNRPFCLYVVIGSHLDVVRLSAEVNGVLDRIKVEAS